MRTGWQTVLVAPEQEQAGTRVRAGLEGVRMVRVWEEGTGCRQDGPAIILHAAGCLWREATPDP